VLAEGMDCPFGIACSGSGAVIAVEGGAGRVWEIAERGRAKVIASGLDRPTGIALASDGTCYVSETGRHRVVRINGGVETVVDGIDTPQGLALDGDSLLVVDAGGRHLTEVGIRERRRTVLASNLPVGNPGGPAPKVLKGVPGIFPGPIVPFAGVVVGSDGRIYIAGDADGSVLSLQRVAQ